MALLLATTCAAQAWSSVSGLRPERRVWHAAVYDDHCSRILLLGGYLQSVPASSPVRQQLWAYTNRQWSVVPTSGPLPVARQHHSMAYDSRRRRVVMYGGEDVTLTPSRVIGDVWEFDATTAAWSQRPAGPTPRSGARMVYDARRGRVVMHGAREFVTRQQTWEYDGSVWTPGPQGPPREQHAVAYDAGRGVTVLFGGFVTQVGILSETWEYDGTSWQQRLPAVSPPALYMCGMDYDMVRGRLVLYGGLFSGNQPSNVTWDYDGATWRTVAANPSAGWLREHVVVYDRAEHRLQLVGGNNQVTSTDAHWRLDYPPAPSITAYGCGCGSPGAPTLAPLIGCLPRLGETLQLELGNQAAGGIALFALGFSHAFAGSTSLPLPLPQFGPKCVLWNSPESVCCTANVAPVLYPVSIPNHQALAGIVFFSQAFVQSGTGQVSLTNSTIAVVNP